MDWIQQLIDFILHIDDHLVELVANYGIFIYIILFLILFAETGLVIAPFLPGDSLLFAAGALAASGNMNVWILILVCIAGAILGNQVNYMIGKYIGPRVYSQNFKWIRKQHIDKTHQFYEKHGGKALIIGRFLPFIRTFVPFIAGVGNMEVGKFTFYNIIGALVWVIPIVMVGYLFGNIPFVKEHFSIIVLIILLLSMIPLFAGLITGLLSMNKKSDTEE
ncbi:MAG: DedA family protein [Saprospiraceae bacterium]|jgi:membrane-associated protein|nr:DedA family protein [Saprospiraceae bacterium]MBL0259668.1 DedA family protein [Saprospiraceae bacterium]